MSSSVLSVVDTQVIRLQIVADPTDWVGLFNHIEVWRSTNGIGGPYANITSNGPKSAKLPLDGGSSSVNTGALVPIQGKELKLLLNETTALNFTFPGVVPLTFSQCATALQNQFSHQIKVFVDEQGKFVIETLGVGGLAAIRVLPSDAAPLLNLSTESPDDVSFGTEPKIPLVNGEHMYSFRDFFGQGSYFYKIRFYNQFDQTVSAFTTPIQGEGAPIGVDPENIVIGYVKLVELNGRIKRYQEVIVYNAYLGESVDGYTVAGSSSSGLTDAKGYVEFSLIRGVTFDVSIPGTALMRRITAPTDKSVQRFDLLDPAYGNNDVFNTQRYEAVYAERRTL